MPCHPPCCTRPRASVVINLAVNLAILKKWSCSTVRTEHPSCGSLRARPPTRHSPPAPSLRRSSPSPAKNTPPSKHLHTSCGICTVGITPAPPPPLTYASSPCENPHACHTIEHRHACPGAAARPTLLRPTQKLFTVLASPRKRSLASRVTPTVLILAHRHALRRRGTVGGTDAA